jgi:hypothetical protein
LQAPVGAPVGAGLVALARLDVVGAALGVRRGVLQLRGDLAADGAGVVGVHGQPGGGRDARLGDDVALSVTTALLCTCQFGARSVVEARAAGAANAQAATATAVTATCEVQLLRARSSLSSA